LSTIVSGKDHFQSSFVNQSWVLANSENKKCFAFKLAQTNHFKDTDRTVKVSDLTGYECNPNDVFN